MVRRICVAVRRFGADESGATAIEYGLIASMLAIALIVSFLALGGGLQNLFGTSSTGAGGAMENGALVVAQD